MIRPKRRRLLRRQAISAREAFITLSARPLRATLMILGPLLGVSGLIATSGITDSAAEHVRNQLLEARSSSIQVTDVADHSVIPGDSFPADAVASVKKVKGVESASVGWLVDGEQLLVRSSLLTNARSATAAVIATDADYFTVVGASLGQGRFFGPAQFSRAARTAVLGSGAARQLGVNSLLGDPSVVIDQVAYVIVGIIDDVSSQPSTLLSVVIPASSAHRDFGPPTTISPATMLVQTRPGTADVVAPKVTRQLRPDNPALLQAATLTGSSAVDNEVNSTVAKLLRLLTLLSLLVGSVTISALTFASVGERYGEIGLRRALGASRFEIATQITHETLIAGLTGGLVGDAIGFFVIIGYCAAAGIEPVTSPTLTLYGPVIGAAVGACAGLVPALRAARTDPAQAVRLTIS